MPPEETTAPAAPVVTPTPAPPLPASVTPVVVAPAAAPVPPPGPPPVAPSVAAAPAPKVSAEQILAFRDAVEDFAPHLSKEQRRHLEGYFRHASPKEVEAWVKQQAAVFPAAAAPTPAAAPAAPAKPQPTGAVTTLGAPGTTAAAAVPPVESMPIEVWRTLAPDEKRKAWTEWERKKAGITDRFNKWLPRPNRG